MLSNRAPAMLRTTAVILGVDEPTEQIETEAVPALLALLACYGPVDASQQVSHAPRVHDAVFELQEVPRGWVARDVDLLECVRGCVAYRWRKSPGDFAESSVELASVLDAQHTPADDCCQNWPLTFDVVFQGLAMIAGQPIRQRHPSRVRGVHHDLTLKK